MRRTTPADRAPSSVSSGTGAACSIGAGSSWLCCGHHHMQTPSQPCPSWSTPTRTGAVQGMRTDPAVCTPVLLMWLLLPWGAHRVSGGSRGSLSTWRGWCGTGGLSRATLWLSQPCAQPLLSHVRCFLLKAARCSQCQARGVLAPLLCLTQVTHFCLQAVLVSFCM